MKKIFFLCVLVILFIGCGEKTFKEISDDVDSKNLQKRKLCILKN